MARHANFDLNRLCEYLQGTCITLDSALEELYPGMEFTDLTAEDHSFIDNEIFCCETCGWWCEISEQAPDGANCTGCAPEEDEDEDEDEGGGMDGDNPDDWNFDDDEDRDEEDDY